MADVKGKRRYNSSGRQEQARRNRDAILQAAERQLNECGYAGTTVAAVAGEAGVSVETVYKAFGGKAGRNNPNKLYAVDIAGTIVAALDMPRRVLWPELAVFATNPWQEN